MREGGETMKNERPKKVCDERQKRDIEMRRRQGGRAQNVNT
jgi:hypothetical protein